MLALILIFYIGRAFYRLAKKHDRSKWLYAIIGVVTYYVAQFLLQVSIAIYLLSGGKNLALGTELVIALIGMLVGAGVVAVFYYILKRIWENNPKNNYQELLDR